MRISTLKIDGSNKYLITDNPLPEVSFSLESDRRSVNLKRAKITVGDWSVETDSHSAVYGGPPLDPFTKYKVRVEAENNYGETAATESEFETGRLNSGWRAKWITDGSYAFKEKKVSPRPMLFKREIRLKGKVRSAKIYCTALGIYELEIDGKKVGDEYFAPGFTSYIHTLAYNAYDITEMLSDGCTLSAHVAGGWAVGSYVFTRKNRITAPRQAFLAEIRITYANGFKEVIGTDESWAVTLDGPFRSADFYDGETFDARFDPAAAAWRQASVEKVKIRPEIIAAYGEPVRPHEVFRPVSAVKGKEGIIYDFGQNFAGVIRAKIKGNSGDKIVFTHAEILKKDGELLREFLRSAKAEAVYICKDGEQEYSPRFTYMGFRYVEVRGIEQENIELSAVALYSDIEAAGSFECSDKLINKLQSNISWSAKSNFVDIPTDCPQRDERMGWTGDISLFGPTACFNFDMRRFLLKWLKDLRAEQKRSGGVPNTVPSQGYGFPATMPVMAIDFWGDASVFVPWTLYLTYGDRAILERSYSSMKRYVDACAFWARLLSLGKRRYIWHTPAVFHFGDWVAPDTDKMSGWQKRSKWTATASLARTSGILSAVAKILNSEADAKKYERLSKKVSSAYISVFTDGNGKLKREFQTAYVLPLYFGMFPPEQAKRAAENLAKLVKDGGYKIGTGFPGTPYILFALADNGQEEAAFKMLMNEDCPSWLYEVKAGGTTVWERWDALKPDGTAGVPDDGTGGMLSFNHYASGAVGDFLYRRVAGIEQTDCGYKTFKIKPVVGGGITYARAHTTSPYGKIASSWSIEGKTFRLEIEVPVSTVCRVELPSGEEFIVGSGKYDFSCEV